MNVDVVSLLQFFDEAPSKSKHHATAIVAVAGEDLGVALLTHFLHGEGAHTEVLDDVCTQGTQKGKRLDKWIRCTQDGETIYYQVEIKNWSAHAIGGKRLPVKVPLEELHAHKKERWSRQWDGKGFRQEPMKKVLIPMKPPVRDCTVEPLACFWDAMHPTGEDEPFFFVPIENGAPFTRVWVFSMAAYLRNLLELGTKKILLNMPDTVARLEWLNRLFQ